ncbi:MAG: acyl--CoA ligase [Ignavibacteria bacterium]|nr:acyl--CoA ligase [Ignavibacteria bacterium]
MILSQNTIDNLQKAHVVNGIQPDQYLVKYRNIFELVEYRAHLQPDEIFITYYSDSFPKTSLTYSEFKEKVFRTSNLMKAHGITQGSRISTISYNHINTVIQYFAAWSIGATVVPVNVSEEPDRIKYILQSSGTKLALVKREYYEKIEKIAHELAIDFIIHGNDGLEPAEGIKIFEDEIAKQSVVLEPDESVNQETEALIVYTSGTTGLPKGVVLTQYNLMVDADGISKWHGITKGNVMMCVLPIHHVNGTVVTIMTPMYSGAKLVLNQKFHTDTFFNRLRDENVNIVSVVPTLLQFLCHDYEKEIDDIKQVSTLPAFRHIICGAGPLTCELVSKFENIFGLKIVHGYGLSETTCYSCFIPTELSEADHRRWLNDYGFPSIGIAIGPNEMDIHDDKGQSLPEDTRGEIVIRGHNVMKYYDENTEANDKTFEFGWFRSGDEGFYKCDDEGRKYFFITGRLKELIIRGGVNIAPLEIDEVLMSLPGVKAGIAVGFDNDWYGEDVGALVELTEGTEPTEDMKQEILKGCRAKLPAYKSPKAVLFTDNIPVTSTGKYQRNKVKHLFAEFKTIQFK